MVGKSIALGLIIYVVDVLFNLYHLLNVTPVNKRDKILGKIKLSLLINLFLQVFFAFIFVFSFKFLAIFKALEDNVHSGLYYAYIMFLPMMYMLFNSSIWFTEDRNISYLHITSWGIKLCICGLFVSFIA